MPSRPLFSDATASRSSAAKAQKNLESEARREAGFARCQAILVSSQTDNATSPHRLAA